MSFTGKNVTRLKNGDCTEQASVVYTYMNSLRIVVHRMLQTVAGDTLNRGKRSGTLAHFAKHSLS